MFAVDRVELVAEVADESLDHVLDGGDPLERAPLVDDGGHLPLIVLEPDEEIADRRRLRNDGHVACEVLGRDRLVAGFPGAQHVFYVDEADHAVRVLVRHDRIAGVFRVEDDRPDRRKVVVSRQAHHVRTWDHHFTDDGVVEVEDASDHLDFGRIDVTGLAGPREDATELPFAECLVGL